jgi:hypothetical protein
MAVTQVLGTDKVIRLNNYSTLGLVQNFNWAPNFNAQDVFELGRTTRLDTLMELETSGSFDVQSSGNLAGLIARMKTEYSAGEFTGFAYAPTASGTMVNNYNYTQDDLAKLKFDIVQHEKTDQATFNRSTYLGCCYPTTISGRVDANGMAMETINWAGQFVVGFPSPYHEIRALACTRTSSSVVTIADNTYHTGYTLAYVTVDGRPIRSAASGDSVYATLGAAGAITLTGATAPSGAVIMAAVFKTSPTATWSTLVDPDVIGSEGNASEVFGIRAFQASVYLAPTQTLLGNGLIDLSAQSAAQWLKVQSLDYNIDLRVETLRQIAANTAGTSVYHRAVTYPLTMSVNASVTETDWADWKAVLDKTFPGGSSAADVHNNSYDFAPANMKKEFAVVVQYFTKDGTLVQQLQFTDLRVDSMGTRVNVGGRSEMTWSFRGTEMRVKGFDIA